MSKVNICFVRCHDRRSSSLKTEDNLKVVRTIPSDRLMLETDCPWCEVRPSHAGSKFVQTKMEAKYKAVKKEKWTKGAMIKSRNEPCNIMCVKKLLFKYRRRNKQLHFSRVSETSSRLLLPSRKRIQQPYVIRCFRTL